MLAHLRTEAYPVYRTHRYPPNGSVVNPDLSYDANVDRIETAQRQLAADTPAPPVEGLITRP
jgi:hypothetical protein